MASDEVYFLHVNGDQRGPYTIPQIRHMFTCGFIDEDTLYWQEGMEQWHPVVEICPAAEHRPVENLWIKLAVIALALIVGALCVRYFGPSLLDKWREMSQHDFTAEAAYWRARDMVRSRFQEKGSYIDFEKFERASVELDDQRTASVRLRGNILTGKGTRRGAWQVEMEFVHPQEEWVARRVVPEGDSG